MLQIARRQDISESERAILGLKLAFRLMQGSFNLMRTHRSGEHDFRRKSGERIAPLPYQARNCTTDSWFCYFPEAAFL